MLLFRRRALLSAGVIVAALAAWGQQASKSSEHPGTPAKSAAASTSPAWRQVQDKDGLCQWSIPADWAPIVAGENTLVQFGKGRAAASLHHNSMKSWEEFKDRIKLQYQPGKVLEDSADRLWFQYTKGPGGLHYYVARPAGAAACAAQLDITDRSDQKSLGPVVQRIASSVGPVPPPAP
ncbi:MAG TPA: hypothetical protein VE825_06285 [Terriglobales bacterium]|jgi:hypothetical protein|nr:hypothetical protein [Terriglobales bacterium]